VHSDQDIGLLPDAEFDQSLNTTGGGLLLRDSDGKDADALGWGNSPIKFTEGNPAPTMENNHSLERAPGGEEGNAKDTDNNAADFQTNTIYLPQNTGSPTTPVKKQRIEISLSAPATAEPGSQFDYTLSVTNRTGGSVHGVSVELPVPEELEIIQLPEGVVLDKNGTIFWNIDLLADGETGTTQITVNVPWTYFIASINSYHVQAENWPVMGFGGPVYTSIEGGVIPIGTARTLMDAELTVEGTATMYTGGYFAGSGNTKFYLEDETGGLQVQVFGGENAVEVPIGAYVRVRGAIGAYRGSMQIVPGNIPDDVEIVTQKSDYSPWNPTAVSIQQAANDYETLPGKLVQVTGVVTRLEEFTYSFEIDLADENGQVITLYIDKLTNINVEGIEVDSFYRATGILEQRDNISQLYPRRPSDLEEVFPPVLLVEADTANSIRSGDTFTTTLTVFNHTPDTVTDLIITAHNPTGNASLEIINDQGSLSGRLITWDVPSLPGEGESVSVSYKVRAVGQDGLIEIADYHATASGWLDGVSGPPTYTFIGNSVPIWAIQGPGNRSPYVLDMVTTEGVVTGIFPDLGGFWIQGTENDEDSHTSEGLFIDSSGFDIAVSTGDLVAVSGQVRESSQQTSLSIEDSEDIELISQDNYLPDPIDLDPPDTTEQAQLYYEAFEGMLVQVSEPAVAVSPTSKYGEFVVVLPHHGVERLWQGQDNGYMIMVDDGSSTTHYDRSTIEYVISTGDQVSDLVGPLAYTYGRYKIEPIKTPEIIQVKTEMPSLPPISLHQFSIMTWNVENLFDVVEPHPSDPPRPRKAEYDVALGKIANTICAAGMPTIIGLQEVENIGILEDLAGLDSLIDYDYKPVLIEGTDSRGIDIGYLVRGDHAEILDYQQHNAPEGLTSRPPLLIQVKVSNNDGHIMLYTLNNHFSSLAGGEIATEPRRTAQAAWNVAIVEQILSEDPDAHITVIGDLNSFLDTLPIQTLEEGGLVHTFDILPEEQRYNYVYEGESQVLDHILTTPNLMGMLQKVVILHVNADFPLPEPDDTSPLRKSDHDPVIAVFNIPP
jgi:predicted extracellular nuclease